eukprot:1831961-Prymnesium_polylepis.1
MCIRDSPTLVPSPSPSRPFASFRRSRKPAPTPLRTPRAPRRATFARARLCRRTTCTTASPRPSTPTSPRPSAATPTR